MQIATSKHENSIINIRREGRTLTKQGQQIQLVITAGVELEILRYQVWSTNHSVTRPRCLLRLRNTFLAWKGPFFASGNRKLGLALRSKASSGQHVDRPLLTDNTTVRAELR